MRIFRDLYSCIRVAAEVVYDYEGVGEEELRGSGVVEGGRGGGLVG